MATKKIINFNVMRNALVAAHNQNNTKAITADQATGAGVDAAAFKKWCSDVNALRETVWNYVAKKKNSRRDAIKAEEIRAARELIYPKWREILAAGEEKVLEKQLRVSENDIEDLIGFSWCFMGTGKGTAEARVGEQIFRRLVESLIGCAIAKNAVLTDEDRETLTAYYGAQKTVQRCIDKIAELNTTIKSYKLKMGEVKGEAKFTEYLQSLIKQAEADKADLEKQQEKAEDEIKTKSKEAQSIEDKMERAK